MAGEEKLPYLQHEMQDTKNPSNDNDHTGEYGPVDDEQFSLVEAAQLRKVYRKLDLRIIPAFWVLYFLCSAVRANVG